MMKIYVIVYIVIACIFYMYISHHNAKIKGSDGKSPFFIRFLSALIWPVFITFVAAVYSLGPLLRMLDKMGKWSKKTVNTNAHIDH
ncbi:MAG: hypothetical protein AAGJ37_17100 [Pseudomonadota bacterium]